MSGGTERSTTVRYVPGDVQDGVQKLLDGGVEHRSVGDLSLLALRVQLGDLNSLW